MEPQHLLPHRVFDQVQGFRGETLIESSPPEGLPSPQLLNCDPNYTLPKLSPFPPRFLSRELQGKKIVVKIKISGHTLDSQPSSSSPPARLILGLWGLMSLTPRTTDSSACQLTLSLTINFSEMSLI